MPRFGLQVLMFLMIFGPKFDGWLDILSLTSLFTFLYFACAFSRTKIPLAARRGSFLFFVGICFLFMYAFCHWLAGVNPDTYQTLRFGRVIINFAGAFALLCIYHYRFDRDAKRLLMLDMYHCLVAHAVIMLGMFLSPAFRDFVVHHMVAVDPDSRTYMAKVAGYRIAGLTDSWDALSGLESLGLLMLPIFVTQRFPISPAYAVLSVPLLLFAVAISGRTGFVTLAILLPVALYYADLRRVHRAVGVATGCLALGVVIWLVAGRTGTMQVVRDSSIMRSLTVLGVEDDVREHESLEDTFDAIREHYFLPDTYRTLFLGTGGSGRDDHDLVAADNGLVLNLHNLGLVCWIVMYGLMFGMLWSAFWLRRTDTATAGVALLGVLIILMIDAKVAYAYARNGFTIMMVLGMLPWWEMRRTGTALQRRFPHQPTRHLSPPQRSPGRKRVA